MGLTRLHISLISVSDMEASVPGGLPRRDSRRLRSDWMESAGSGGVAVGVGVAGGGGDVEVVLLVPLLVVSDDG